ncbi:uncharacterized protein LOC100368187 [Saccoglossus kowalevskii]|uniref:Uncharacterized protein LOC100368187 n=1 Tax=Saccoglossus kowalevskii TaxID=10224 RepID=A0ABM0GSS4_SACKO|nr:PREDICTED: uncharacterized protein LOC100368187 [Saccoglossus kowalevskii]
MAPFLKGKIVRESLVILLMLSVCVVVKSYTTVIMTNDLNSQCGEAISDVSSGVIKSYREPNYATNWHCDVTIAVQTDQVVLLRFETFNAYSKYDDCRDNNLKVYDGSNVYSQLLTPNSGLCTGVYSTSSDVPKYILSTGSSITLYLIRENTLHTEFNIIVSAVMKIEGSFCFNCWDNSSCLDPEVKCDSIRNCADGSDESTELEGGCFDGNKIAADVTNPRPFIAAALVVIVIALIIIIIAVFVCRCRRQQNHHPSARKRATDNASSKECSAHQEYPPKQAVHSVNYQLAQPSYQPCQDRYSSRFDSYDEDQPYYYNDSYPPHQDRYPSPPPKYPPQGGDPSPPPVYAPSQGVAYYPQKDHVLLVGSIRV